MIDKNSIRTRIAPSPTGEDIHIGNLYTALINYIVAKKENGSFIVRIEDTDRTRLISGSAEKILSTLKTYGIVPDEGPENEGKYGPYVQSERLEIYEKHADELVQNDKAYYCFCTKEKLEEFRQDPYSDKRHWNVCNDKNNTQLISTHPYVIRLKVPANTDISFIDVIRGEIKINTDQIDDQVLLKSDGYPTYHLAVVIDDYLMKISHVIRAEEWISSTPKHVLLYKAFGWELPMFAHVPILRNPDKSKLSKRKNPVWASWYIDEGFLPEAVLNFLALMGWGHPNGKEIFSISELIEVFNLKDVQTVGPVFDLTKLTWMNQQYIQSLSSDELKEKLIEFYKDNDQIITLLKGEKASLVLEIVKTRLNTLKEFSIGVEFLFNSPEKSLHSDEHRNIAPFIEKQFDLISIDEWNKDSIFKAIKYTMTENNIKKMTPFYILFTGRAQGLPLPEMLEILGKEETITRLKSVNS